MTRITKREWTAHGGLSNPNLFRVWRTRHWLYYRDTSVAMRAFERGNGQTLLAMVEGDRRDATIMHRRCYQQQSTFTRPAGVPPRPASLPIRKGRYVVAHHPRGDGRRLGGFIAKAEREQGLGKVLTLDTGHTCVPADVLLCTKEPHCMLCLRRPCYCGH